MPWRQILYPIRCSYRVQSNPRLQNKSHYIPVRDVAVGVFWVECTCSVLEPPGLVTGISAQSLLLAVSWGFLTTLQRRASGSVPTELLVHSVIQMRYNHFRQHLMLICRTLKSVKRDNVFCSVDSGVTIRTSDALSHPECSQNKHLWDREPEKRHRILKRWQAVKSAGQLVTKVQAGMRAPFTAHFPEIIPRLGRCLCCREIFPSWSTLQSGSASSE